MVNSQKIRSIFYGTSEFGLPVLEWLQQNTDLVAIVTTPDKPAGRKAALTPSPVKSWAVERSFRILQPADLRDENFEKTLLELGADIGVVASYGKIIPRQVLEIPRHKTLNLHPSLLPKYRGATPIQAAIMNGDEITGVSLMLMDEKLDHGPVVAQTTLAIDIDETYESLHEKTSRVSAEILKNNLENYLNNKIEPQPQDDRQATFTKILKKDDGLIDWHKSAEEIERQVRALQPWPSAYTRIKNYEARGKDSEMILKIYKAKVASERSALAPADVLIEDKQLFIGTGTKSLAILELQLSGGKRLPAKEFLQGRRHYLEIQT